MSSFFKRGIEERLSRNKEKYQLLKLKELIDWSAVGELLKKQRQNSRKDARGNASYDALKMFKAVLLGQWHSLSDEALEHALNVRIDFMVFCDFDEQEQPDHSTLCRFRQWLSNKGLMPILLGQINDQLASRRLKVSKAQTAVVDASIIESRGMPQTKAIEVDEASGEVSETPPSKDVDARWIKKAGRFYLGYKLHASCDEAGFINELDITPANRHETKHLEPLIEHLPPQTRVLADKGYASRANRDLLKKHRLRTGIMHKAAPNQQISPWQKIANTLIKRKRYVIEQRFGVLKRRFNFYKSSYFGTKAVLAQAFLKVMCLNLLKACNLVRYA
jgi:IS5 family transposase